MTTLESGPILARLHRVEGQVRGIARMVDQRAHCIDTVTQIAAASGALRVVALMLLDDHLRRCLAETDQAGGNTRDDTVREAMAAISRLVRSQ